MIFTSNGRGVARRAKCARGAFTLIELMVVMLLLVMLAAVGLPALKHGLKDQKASQAVRQVQAYLELARSRAMSTGRPVGVIIDRLGVDDPFSRSYSIQMRLSNSVPPYAGESDAALAYLFHDASAPAASPTATNAALFDAWDTPLLAKSAMSGGGPSAPIRLGDRIEFQGGRTVAITSIGVPKATDPILPNAPPGQPTIKITFDPRESIPYRAGSAATFATFGFPASLVPTTTLQPAKFRIHRIPVPSAAAPLSMVRGMVIDMNYSGIGPDGYQFAPAVIDHTPSEMFAAASTSQDFQPVVIMFAADGSVEYVSWGNVSGTVILPMSERPAGNIYLCIGTSDGVRPDDPLATADREVANIMNPETSWIVINPFNGNIYASPSATVTAPATVADAVLKSRQYALTADTLSAL